jgi:hypothetical protein
MIWENWNYLSHSLVSYQNIIDWNVNKLDKKTNESHDQETNSSSSGNVGEFLSVGLSAFLDKVDGILGKLP